MPYNTATNVGFAYGVQIHLPNQNIPQVIQAASALDVAWVKQQIEWAVYEPNAGSINWAPLDEMVNAMDAAGFNILLTVSSAPGWARDSDQEKGPPTDYQTYANFVGQLAQRYKGKVDAYEVWNEQNLRREWNTPRGISAASYVELLRLAYTAIKNADSAALVVTGGLAPTGFNDGVNAIDDRVYLRQMYAAGVAEWSDAIARTPMAEASRQTAHAAATIARRCPPGTIIRASSSSRRSPTTARSWLRAATAAPSSGRPSSAGVE